jgi:hypothetical protein
VFVCVCIVIDGISSNQSAQYIGDVIQNSTKVVNETIQGLQEAGSKVGDEISSVLAGNTTVVQVCVCVSNGVSCPFIILMVKTISLGRS